MNKTLITITASLLAINSYAHGDEVEPQTQTGNKTTTTITTTTVSEETTDWGYDGKDGRSRVGMSSTKLPGKTKIIKSTTEISQVMDIKQTTNDLLCESDIDLEYYQKDTSTEVRTLFTSENCSEFDAKYQLRILYFDANGDIQRIVADEEWPVGRTEQFKKQYPMKPDSELRRVSSRILSCTCREN